jgi:hypothetical protein
MQPAGGLAPRSFRKFRTDVRPAAQSCPDASAKPQNNPASGAVQHALKAVQSFGLPVIFFPPRTRVPPSAPLVIVTPPGSSPGSDSSEVDLQQAAAKIETAHTQNAKSFMAVHATASSRGATTTRRGFLLTSVGRCFPTTFGSTGPCADLIFAVERPRIGTSVPCPGA